MKLQITFCMLVLSCIVRAQSVENIKARYLCNVKGQELDAVSPSASIQLNLNDGEIVFRDAIGSMTTGKTEIDTILDNFKNIKILYEGNIQENVNDFLEGDVKADVMHVSGTLLINGVSKPMGATCVPIRYNKSSNELYLNFNLIFDPDDFKLTPAFPFSEEIEISIKNGFVNKIE